MTGLSALREPLLELKRCFGRTNRPAVTCLHSGCSRYWTPSREEASHTTGNQSSVHIEDSIEKHRDLQWPTQRWVRQPPPLSPPGDTFETGVLWNAVGFRLPIPRVVPMPPSRLRAIRGAAPHLPQRQPPMQADRSSLLAVAAGSCSKRLRCAAMQRRMLQIRGYHRHQSAECEACRKPLSQDFGGTAAEGLVDLLQFPRRRQAVTSAMSLDREDLHHSLLHPES